MTGPAAGEARPLRRTPRDYLNAFLVSCGGLGYSPVASGTMGTLGALGIVLLCLPLRTRVSFDLLLAALIVGGTILGLLLGGWAERHYGTKDPSPFVLDELVGYWIALVRFSDGVPPLRELWLAFFAFRFFDVIKPPPARGFERLPAGLGIMLDDIVAGIYANLLLTVVRETFWS